MPRLLGHIPPFAGRYVEPFFDGGAMFFHLCPKSAIVNDINATLMKFYLGVRDNYEGLRIELDAIENLYESNRRAYERQKAQTPDERVDDANDALYYRLRDQYNGLAVKEYSDALLYFYINKTAYSGMIRYNASGEFNVPYGVTSILTLSWSRSHTAGCSATRSSITRTTRKFLISVAAMISFFLTRPTTACFRTTETKSTRTVSVRPTTAATRRTSATYLAKCFWS